MQNSENTDAKHDLFAAYRSKNIGISIVSPEIIGAERVNVPAK